MAARGKPGGKPDLAILLGAPPKGAEGEDEADAEGNDDEARETLTEAGFDDSQTEAIMHACKLMAGKY